MPGHLSRKLITTVHLRIEAVLRKASIRDPSANARHLISRTDANEMKALSISLTANPNQRAFFGGLCQWPLKQRGGGVADSEGSVTSVAGCDAHS